VNQESKTSVKVSSSEKFVSVVDDEIDISHLFRDALCEDLEGMKVLSFNDPITALQHYTENKSAYSLVISDLRMPGLNGLELLKKVKESNSSVRTMLMSAYLFSDDKLYREYIEKGIIDSTIEKPVSIQKLCHLVKDELEVYQVINS
jgi:DNA-binding NtrC family response regulator